MPVVIAILLSMIVADGHAQSRRLGVAYTANSDSSQSIGSPSGSGSELPGIERFKGFPKIPRRLRTARAAPNTLQQIEPEALDALPVDLLEDAEPVDRRRDAEGQEAARGGKASREQGAEPFPNPIEVDRGDDGDALLGEIFTDDLLNEHRRSGAPGAARRPIGGDLTPSESSSATSGTDSSNEDRLDDVKFFTLEPHPPTIPSGTRRTAYDESDFAPEPLWQPVDDAQTAASIYRGKFPVPVQRPWLEWGRPLYTGGIYPPGRNWFGSTNLVMPHFMIYGDLRTGVGVNRNAAGRANAWANRLNLDMDLELTATERIHAFTGPLDRGGDFTRLDFSDDVQFINRTDMRVDTLFFEGDAGAILGGVSGSESPFDLPFTFGLMPLFYQNGVWANDAVLGAAFALPARHNRRLGWDNFDATFFWAADQVTSDAFAGQDSAAEFFGTAWFIDAYDGYIEANYAFVNDDVGGNRSYHNLSLAFTRRYFSRISNAIRLISNVGQDLPSGERTADGHLLLLENSLISAAPNTFVPYFNLFYGQGRPQSLARAGIAGGVLNNVGINFETDGLTLYPTLDPTARNNYGGAIGVNILGDEFTHQLILEAAAVGAIGSSQFRNSAGDQYAVGVRYQKPLNHAWIFRTDHMYGWLRDAEDIRGSRVEFRWKF